MQKSLLDVPSEVISHHVLPMFDWNDLLRMRRVCKPIKLMADDFIRLHGIYKAHLEVAIGEDETEGFDNPWEKKIALEELLTMDLKIPSSKFSISFPSVKDLFDDGRVKVDGFVESYGTDVETLRVSKMTLPPKEGELAFYRSLPNLTRLYIDEMEVTEENDQWESEWRDWLPVTFINLTHLIIDEVKITSDGRSFNFFMDTFKLWDLIKFCERLEYFRPPDLKTAKPDKLLYGEVCFRQIMELVTTQESSPGGICFKTFDMQNFQLIDRVPHLLTREFFPFCDRYNVKIANLDLIIVRSDRREWTRPLLQALGRILISAKNCITFDLPLVEHLVVDETSYCLWNRDGDPLEMGIKWASLKSIDLIINSGILRDKLGSARLFKFLFANIGRPQMKELRLKCGSIPSTENIGKSCYHLTKLTIESWSGKNEELAKLWEGLLYLEEVTLNSCYKLGDLGFIGSDEQNPVFLNLRELRKFRLLNMDEMPDVTDTSFQLVFRHLRLKQFYITSNEAISTISLAGIEALLGGGFSRTIEKFPFDTWSLRGVGPDDMVTLKNKFRSSFMI